MPRLFSTRPFGPRAPGPHKSGPAKAGPAKGDGGDAQDGAALPNRMGAMFPAPKRQRGGRHAAQPPAQSLLQAAQKAPAKETPPAAPEQKPEQTPELGPELGDLGEDYNYGGRDKSPDTDVNPAADIAVEETPDPDDGSAANRARNPAARMRTPDVTLTLSALPPHAFGRGTLFDED